MLRFIVTRQYVKHKGHLYQKGELLPPEFTERDKFRNLYPSRIGTTVVEEVKTEVAKPDVKPQGVEQAKVPVASPSLPTGTPKVMPPNKSVSLSGNQTK